MSGLKPSNFPIIMSTVGAKTHNISIHFCTNDNIPSESNFVLKLQDNLEFEINPLDLKSKPEDITSINMLFTSTQRCKILLSCLYSDLKKDEPKITIQDIFTIKQKHYLRNLIKKSKKDAQKKLSQAVKKDGKAVDYSAVRSMITVEKNISNTANYLQNLIISGAIKKQRNERQARLVRERRQEIEEFKKKKTLIAEYQNEIDDIRILYQKIKIKGLKEKNMRDKTWQLILATVMACLKMKEVINKNS